jgi:hypothetical protein
MLASDVFMSLLLSGFYEICSIMLLKVPPCRTESQNP